MADERGDVGHALKSVLHSFSLSLLVCVEQIWLISGEPWKDLPKLGFLWRMPQHQNVLWIDTLLLK